MHRTRNATIDVGVVAQLTGAVVAPARRVSRGVERTCEAPTQADARVMLATRHRHGRRVIVRAALAELPVRVGTPAPCDTRGVESARARGAGGKHPERVTVRNASGREPRRVRPIAQLAVTVIAPA